MGDYHINIFWSDEDGGYIADIPDLRACSAFGASPAEALAQVELAKAAWLEAARAEGKPIPAPRYRPRANRRHTLIVTRGGRPIAALMPIATPADIESFKVSRSPTFQALIAESRRVNPPGTGLTTAQVRRALAPRRSRRVRP